MAEIPRKRERCISEGERTRFPKFAQQREQRSINCKNLLSALAVHATKVIKVEERAAAGFNVKCLTRFLGRFSEFCQKIQVQSWGR